MAPIGYLTGRPEMQSVVQKCQRGLHSVTWKQEGEKFEIFFLTQDLASAFCAKLLFEALHNTE